MERGLLFPCPMEDLPSQGGKPLKVNLKRQRDGLVIEFTQDGSFETIRRYGGPRANQALAISHAGLDSYAVAGTSTDPEKDNQDIWLVIGRELLQIPLSPQGSAP